jgi:hypothetical protein
VGLIIERKQCVPEFVSPKICGFPSLAAADTSAAKGSISEAIAVWLMRVAKSAVSADCG